MNHFSESDDIERMDLPKRATPCNRPLQLVQPSGITTTWDDLPTEVLLRVMEFLSLIDVLNCLELGRKCDLRMRDCVRQRLVGLERQIRETDGTNLSVESNWSHLRNHPKYAKDLKLGDKVKLVFRLREDRFTEPSENRASANFGLAWRTVDNDSKWIWLRGSVECSRDKVWQDEHWPPCIFVLAAANLEMLCLKLQTSEVIWLSGCLDGTAERWEMDSHLGAPTALGWGDWARNFVRNLHNAWSKRGLQ